MRGCLRVLATGMAVALLASSLAGCGRRGGLEPAPDPSAPATTTGKGGDTLVMRRPKVVPITPPHDAFILDPLL